MVTDRMRRTLDPKLPQELDDLAAPPRLARRPKLVVQRLPPMRPQQLVRQPRRHAYP